MLLATTALGLAATGLITGMVVGFEIDRLVIGLGDVGVAVQEAGSWLLPTLIGALISLALADARGHPGMMPLHKFGPMVIGGGGVVALVLSVVGAVHDPATTPSLVPISLGTVLVLPGAFLLSKAWFSRLDERRSRAKAIRDAAVLSGARMSPHVLIVDAASELASTRGAGRPLRRLVFSGTAHIVVSTALGIGMCEIYWPGTSLTEGDFWVVIVSLVVSSSTTVIGLQMSQSAFLMSDQDLGDKVSRVVSFLYFASPGLLVATLVALAGGTGIMPLAFVLQVVFPALSMCSGRFMLRGQARLRAVTLYQTILDRAFQRAESRRRASDHELQELSLESGGPTL